MSTRGAVGFVIDGEEKIGYNHSDSYPSGVGVDVLKWAADVTNWTTIKKLARDLKLVDDDIEPTEDQVKELIRFHDAFVSTGMAVEWYSLLRHTQGDPAKMLEAGFMEDAAGFPFDSLFCEWAYIVDLDEEQLEAYRGFQQEPHAEGRFGARFVGPGHHWVDSEEHPDHSHPDICFRCQAKRGTPEFEQVCPEAYYPIKLVASFSLDSLPSPEEFVAKLEPPEEEEAA